jgi:ABC-type nitrate/sulfonate/bicarbonate transport system substrate-binding protein
MLGTPSRGLFEFPVVVAMRRGFFNDEGLDVRKIQMQPAIGVKALISGDIDYFLAWGSTLRAAATGVPVKVVVGLAERPLHVLISRPEIKTGKDLKGKRSAWTPSRVPSITCRERRHGITGSNPTKTSKSL